MLTWYLASYGLSLLVLFFGILLHMEFTHLGKKFALRGAKTPTAKLINNKSFAKAVSQGAEL